MTGIIIKQIKNLDEATFFIKYSGNTQSNACDKLFSNFISASTINSNNFIGNGSGLTDIDNFFITGQTFDNLNYTLSSYLNNGVVINTDLSHLSSDIFLESGIYNPLNGVITFTNSTGGTFQVSGFITGMTGSFTDSANLNDNIIEFNNNIEGSNFYSVDLYPILSGKTDSLLFNSHTANTNNPHQTTFANLINTAHTHTLGGVSDFISYSDSVQSQINNKLNTLTFNTYTAGTQNLLDSKIENGVNFGGAYEIFSGKSENNLYFKTLSGGSNIILNENEGVILINSTTPENTDSFVTGGTYNSQNSSLTLNINNGNSVIINDFSINNLNNIYKVFRLTGSTDYIFTDFNIINTISLNKTINSETNITLNQNPNINDFYVVKD